MSTYPDIVIIGSGMGGATVASGLAASGAKILILEAGEHLADIPENRDSRAIYQRGYFRPKELWYDQKGDAFNPGNYYNVGGNSKFYGAVLIRYRREDFAELKHQEGISPAWPFSYDELEPYYSRAEQLYNVRGSLTEDPTEPRHSQSFPFAPVPDEPLIALIKNRLKANGYHPFALPLGVDIDRWMAKSKVPWDGHVNSDDGKMDAESCALADALKHPNVSLQTGSRVTKLETDASGKTITRIHYVRAGSQETLAPGLVILSAGAVQSAALLLRSANAQNQNGLANRSDQVGRNFMNHNTSAVIGVSPWYKNDSIYQKTFGLNDYYFSDGEGGAPLGNIQLLGRVSGAILKANVRVLPEWVLNKVSAHSIDFLAMSEDLPDPNRRITVNGDKIILNWKRSNWDAHLKLVSKTKTMLKRAGFPLVLTRAFDRKTPSHQCGTIRMGLDAQTAPLDIFCRTFDHPNLFVVDASFLPTSAAVNPALTIAAQALRVADHIKAKDLKS